MQEVKFTCTALKGNAQGVLPVDADGYFTIPVGGLNCFNSAGQYYPYESARQLFEQSSSFMRRVNNGCLKGEMGHPKRLPGQSDEEFAQRILTIDEKSVCAHFAEIWLDFNSVKDNQGRPIVAVMGKVKPSGPYASALEHSFVNCKEDVCFSVRAFTEDTQRLGVRQRNLVEIVTYDYVTEPGISTARKYKSPTLEAMGDASFSKESLEKAVATADAFALESAARTCEAMFKRLGWDLSHLSKPKYLSW